MRLLTSLFEVGLNDRSKLIVECFIGYSIFCWSNIILSAKSYFGTFERKQNVTGLALPSFSLFFIAVVITYAYVIN